MRYFIIFIFCMVTSVGTLFGQETTGFSDPDAIHQLLDYRLPDWGYSNFLLDFSSNGRLINLSDTWADGDFEDKIRTVQLYVNPKHTLYRESEERIFSLNSELFFAYEGDRDERSETTEQQTQKARSWSSEVHIDTELREYISSNIFLLGQEDIRFRVNSSSREETLNESVMEDEDQFQRNFSSTTRLGIGMGRIRNVTPVVRALRLKERYNILTNNGLDDTEIRNAADMFTKYDGYQQKYDRPEKYFWQDMDEAINTSISGLEPFDLFYVTDVLDENIGRRLEGWEVATGGNFYYDNNLNRIENPLETPSLNRSLNIQKRAGIFVNTRWYKNLSLTHQLGFTADIGQNYPLDSDAIVQRNTEIIAEASWLWNITERFLLDTRLTDRYDDSKMEGVDEPREWRNRALLSSNFVYFIENRLAINLGVGYELIYQGDTNTEPSFDLRRMELYYNAGIKYYFSRNLY